MVRSFSHEAKEVEFFLVFICFRCHIIYWSHVSTTVDRRCFGTPKLCFYGRRSKDFCSCLRFCLLLNLRRPVFSFQICCWVGVESYCRMVYLLLVIFYMMEKFYFFRFSLELTMFVSFWAFICCMKKINSLLTLLTAISYRLSTLIP